LFIVLVFVIVPGATLLIVPALFTMPEFVMLLCRLEFVFAIVPPLLLLSVPELWKMLLFVKVPELVRVPEL